MPGHLGFVLGVAFSPDDGRLYSCSIEGDVHVWDPGRRVRLDIWSGCHRGAILSLVVSANGEVVTAGLDGSVVVWSATGELKRRLAGHSAGVHAVAVWDGSSDRSRDGLRDGLRGGLVASASADRRLALWRRDTGELIRYLEGHDETVTSVAFLDEHLLLSGSRDRTVRLWDLSGNAAPLVFEGHDWWVTKVAPVAGGQFVSTSEDGTLRLWHPSEAEARWVFEESPGPIWGLGVDPTGERAVVGYGGDAYAVDLTERRSEPLPKVAPVSARAICFSANGSLLALGEDHGQVDLLNIAGSGGSGTLAGNGYPVLSGVVRPDVLATGRVSGAVQSLSSSAGVTDHQGHDFFTYCCRYVGKGRFASGGFDKQVRVWQPGEAGQIAGARHGGLIFSLDWDPDGNRLMAAGWDRISVFSLPGLEVLWRLEEGGVGNHLVSVFTTHGRIAGVGEAPVLKVWAEGREVASHRLPDAHNCVIESVPGEGLVAVGSAYGRVSLVNVDSGESQPLHGEHEDWIRVLRVSPDGRRIFSVSQNGSGRLFDRSANRVVERFEHRPIAIGDFAESVRLHWLDCLGATHTES